jgi:hypothetical protein
MDRLCGLLVIVPGYWFRGPGFDSRRYQIFWEVVCLEKSPLSLVSTTEELFGRASSDSGLENQEYDRRGSVTPITWKPLSSKATTNFADKRLSLGPYNSLAHSGHGGFFLDMGTFVYIMSPSKSLPIHLSPHLSTLLCLARALSSNPKKGALIREHDIYPSHQSLRPWGKQKDDDLRNGKPVIGIARQNNSCAKLLTIRPQLWWWRQTKFKLVLVTRHADWGPFEVLTSN